MIRNKSHLEKIVGESLNPQRAREQLLMLERSILKKIQGLRILEVGSGYGLAVAIARTEFGADAYGIEPGADEFSGAYAVSRKALELAHLPPDVVLQGIAEDIPFPDSHFDCVFSSNVLEHVQNPQQVIDESLRVLKPSGFLHIVVPNYGSWWEGHYGILWFPNLPLSLGKMYIRLQGRDPSFLETLQFINHNWLGKMLTPYQGKIEVLGWGIDVWEERVLSLGFSEWSTLGKLKSILRFVHRVGLARVIVGVGKVLHWETPIILTVQKID